jgi:hypothetical protein
MMATERRSTTPNRAGGIAAASVRDPDVIYNDPMGDKARNPGNEGPATMKGATRSHVSPDGVNKPIPRTNNTKAPGQWGTS